MAFIARPTASALGRSASGQAREDFHSGDSLRGPEGYPVSFEGSVRVNGQEHQFINVTDNRETQVYRAKIEPVTIDSFRLTIRASANPAYPNAAQVSEIELYP